MKFGIIVILVVFVAMTGSVFLMAVFKNQFSGLLACLAWGYFCGRIGSFFL